MNVRIPESRNQVFSGRIDDLRSLGYRDRARPANGGDTPGLNDDSLIAVELTRPKIHDSDMGKNYAMRRRTNFTAFSPPRRCEHIANRLDHEVRFI